MSLVRVTLPYPPKALSPNGRPSTWEKARAVKAYRTDCFLLGKQARPASYPLRSPVQARIVFQVAGPGPLPDEQNALAAFKAGIDGLVDARLMVDDSPAHFHIADVLVQRGPRREVRVLLEELEELEEAE